ncbi:MAG: hypothetical protein QM402_09885, partial [Synergistota bacterium]|nr:hypothetical protein [Synergistota bacterium]
ALLHTLKQCYDKTKGNVAVFSTRKIALLPLSELIIASGQMGEAAVCSGNTGAKTDKNTKSKDLPRGLRMGMGWR